MLLGRTVFVIALVLGGSMAGAGGIKGADPLEIPPGSYQGRQFVDSAGCVFVRAREGVATIWTARLGRDGAHLCGYKPTFERAAQRQTAATPQIAPAELAATPPANAERTRTGYRRGLSFKGAAAKPAVAPKRVRSASLRLAPMIPKGYRPAWDDGRLNPKRAIGTAAGRAQMAQVWTDEVPARLLGNDAAKH